jgi:hypothetical protein
MRKGIKVVNVIGIAENVLLVLCFVVVYCRAAECIHESNLP